MQTTGIHIIIVKQKLIYVKNEVTMTDYDSPGGGGGGGGNDLGQVLLGMCYWPLRTPIPL